ncbi:MAG: glycosyltransferase family 4 protein [Streptosporangiaceae bacterium]
MRIAIVTETWRPHVDGVITRLAATVRDLRRRGYDVLVVSPDGGERDYVGATVRGVPTFRVPFVYGGQPWGLPLPRVGRYLDEFRPDVVHVVNPIMLGIAGVLATKRRRLPLVASYHTDIADYAAYYHLGWLRPFVHWLTRKLHNQAAVNLATSATSLAQLNRLGIPGARLWRRGVDLTLFDPGRRDRKVRQRLGAEDGQVLALYVGRLSAEKGLHRLEPLARGPDCQLVLVGDGPDRSRLARRFAGLPVTFCGTLQGQLLADAYAAADVFVFPSTTDTLGLVLLEAMASGLPVVAADTPAIRETLRDHPHRRLFPPDRPGAVRSLAVELASANGDPRHGAAATRTVVSRWSWKAATDQLVGYYETAVRTGGPAPTSNSLSAGRRP